MLTIISYHIRNNRDNKPVRGHYSTYDWQGNGEGRGGGRLSTRFKRTKALCYHSSVLYDSHLHASHLHASCARMSAILLNHIGTTTQEASQEGYFLVCVCVGTKEVGEAGRHVVRIIVSVWDTRARITENTPLETFHNSLFPSYKQFTRRFFLVSSCDYDTAVHLQGSPVHLTAAVRNIQ